MCPLTTINTRQTHKPLAPMYPSFSVNDHPPFFSSVIVFVVGVVVGVVVVVMVVVMGVVFVGVVDNRFFIGR